ncbi:hypothetical protein B0H16DRAFT_1821851 [Mycena metata]|uniref:F-box domain-containing protein n=1 Tax=Mycena metata TaxID=1033252 RepID=A0AAD7MBF3_9AGAR|nr:hypothetical protein B0H16DRAFT_1821851 [Mycena metata]
MADPQAARERRVADRARILDIAARIIDLELVSPLRAERKLLEAEQETLQERLDAYTYPVLSLPPEIVSEIFVHFLPAYPKRAPQKGPLSPIILGHICRLWRAIAFSTSRLWRTFKLVRYATDSGQSDHADQVRVEAALRRSGSCPISVELEYFRLKTTLLFETIMAHRARWQHLKLFLSANSLGAIIGPFPLLRTLTTTAGFSFNRDAAHRPTTFHSAPLLRRVAINSYKDIFLETLPWSQLTVLIIKHIEMNQCLQILALASNLVYSDLTFFRLGEGDIPRNVMLAHLKHLKLWGLDPFLSPLHILTLPALQRLHIDEESLYPDPIAVLRSLLSRWGSSPPEIRIGFPALPLHLYSAALPSIVFSSTQRYPLPIRFLDPQSTNLLGLEATNIDEEGDWEEMPLSESEESDSDSGEESNAQEENSDRGSE